MSGPALPPAPAAAARGARGGEDFVATLCGLRWVAVAGQSLTILVTTRLLDMALPLAPLWGGVAALAAFNLYAQRRAGGAGPAPPAEAFLHVLVDVVVLTWQIAWSGGIANPFGSLFILPIALTALALPLPWTLATTVLCLAGYAVAGIFGRPLPHLHGGDFDLHLWGMAANFVVSVAVVLFFSTRLVAARDRRERELAAMRERFARDEGILALATHAASVAHELNTPLGTLTLLLDDMEAAARAEAGVRPAAAAAGGASGAAPQPLLDDLATLRALVAVCRERVRELASPADPDRPADIDLERVLDRWRLVRPAVELRRSGALPRGLRVERAVGHLLLALLNNAADASERSGGRRVDLRLEVAAAAKPDGNAAARDADGAELRGEIRDYGAGFAGQPLFLPALFRSSKPDGLGVGLALSHATLERLGGELGIESAEGGGARVRFRVPLPAAAVPSGPAPTTAPASAPGPAAVAVGAPAASAHPSRPRFPS